MTASPFIFDRNLLNAHRTRAAIDSIDGSDFLWKECADRLVDKLGDINRKFPVALDLGCHHGALHGPLRNHFDIETIIHAERNAEMLTHAPSPKIIMDEEWLAFRENSVNLVISIGSLQWVNDLPGTLKQIFHILKPDGLFLCMFPGGDTLIELKTALHEAMQRTTGGLSPRSSPMIDVPDAGALLQRAGFELPVVDREHITVSYPHPLKLLHDLRAMGQTNALIHRASKPLTRNTLLKMSEIYAEHFSDAEGNVLATFDMLTLTGWKPIN